MTIQRSNAQISVILNDHRVIGWAEEDPPYEFEWPDLADIKTGADGGKYGMAIPDFGCGFTLKLSDVSPSLQHFIRERTRHMNALRQGIAIPVFQGSITDLSFGVSGTFQGGWIANAPGFPGGAGSTNEVMFGFELWTPAVEGGSFTAPLMNAA